MDMLVDTTLDRAALWAAETPQVFLREWLEDAYEHCRRNGMHVTDDSQAVQLCGHGVALVENSACNLKITHREDLAMLGALLQGTGVAP